MEVFYEYHKIRIYLHIPFDSKMNTYHGGSSHFGNSFWPRITKFNKCDSRRCALRIITLD